GGRTRTQKRCALTPVGQERGNLHLTLGDCFVAALLAMTIENLCHCEEAAWNAVRHRRGGRRTRTQRSCALTPVGQERGNLHLTLGDCFVAALLAMTIENLCHCEEAA